MIERIIDFCARNRVLVFMGVAALLGWSVWCIKNTPLDALPDLTDTQVIIATEWMGRSPDLIEDQITYPLVTTFLAAPKVKLVRGFTMFGMSFVYVIFEDGTDVYWARSRTLEYLSKLQGRLPPGVTPQIGPDATGLGWIFEYALVDDTGTHDLAQIRSFQDWSLRYWLSSVPGVAEVASVGGYEKQYQIEVDPTRLQAFRLSVVDISNAVRASNMDVGGRVLEAAGHEYAVRGRGYIQKKEDIEQVVVGTDGRGTPIRVGDVAKVQIGGNIRRGFAELDGTGETVGGIVVMRYGENALDVIDRIKQKLADVQPAFPKGVRLVTTYDRSDLIKASVKTLTDNLIQVMLIVCAMIVVFLLHFRSALVAAITLPIAVALAFIPMYYMGLTANIMSLAGIIIAIGDMVDSAVVLVENAHKKLELEPTRPRTDVIIEAARELGPSIFGSLLVIAVSFLPVFVLEAQEGRLFKPLAYTKTFSMLFAALLSVTLVPTLMVLLIRGKIRPEQQNPLNRFFIWLYRPLLRFCLKARYGILALVALLFAVTIPVFNRLGSEFMPPLEEGSIMFMPITIPSISIEEAKKLVQVQNRILKQFPEVVTVFGKAGRAETATDPAPLSMIETVITLKPPDQWRTGVTKEKLVAEMEEAIRMPGLQNAWTQPIKARVDMLSTGIRTPVGVKVFGPDLAEVGKIGEDLEHVLRDVPGTRSVYAEREMGGLFIDFIPDRAIIARYGLRVADVLNIVQSAIGGDDIDTTIEGRERYKINVRYPREYRDDLDKLKRVQVPVSGLIAPTLNEPSGGMGGAMSGGAPSGDLGSALVRASQSSSGSSGMGGGMGGTSGSGGMGGGMGGTPVLSGSPAAGGSMPTGGMGNAGGGMGGSIALIPLSQLGRFEVKFGPPMIKDESGSLAGWVYVDVESQDIGGYVRAAKLAVAEKLQLPTGYYIQWTGQYEFMERVAERMKLVVPLTLLLVFVILYFNFRGVTQVLMVLLAVPFAAVGSIWLMFLLNFNTSIAVWVGMIALLGVAAETASIMVVYLDQGFIAWRKDNRIHSMGDLIDMAVECGSRRVRPLLMTVGMNIVGLIPVMIGTGIGSDVAKRIAAPMWGGLISLTILTLIVIPILYVVWRGFQMRKELGTAAKQP